MESNRFEFRLLTTLTVLTILSLALPTGTHAQESRTANSVNTIATNLTGFTVPFALDNKQGEYIEVHLYVSRDQGQSWQYHAKQDVNADGFDFQTKGDGEYWFALKSLNRDRQLVPTGKITKPELQIVVDSQKPTIAFHVDSDAAGRVITSWRIQDQNLDADSLKISHRDALSPGVAAQPGDWKSVEFNTTATSINGNFVDRVAWWPVSNSRRIEVQLTVTDTAGNSSSATRTLTLKTTTIQHNNANSTTIVNRFSGANEPLAQSSPSASGKPSNVVCENGVCRIVQDKTPAQPASWRRDVFQTTDSSRFATNETNANNRGTVWGRRLAARPRVGSAVEQVAPPVPAGFRFTDREYVARQQANSNQFANDFNPTKASEPTGQSSIEWTSKSSNRGSHSLSAGASTLNQNNFPRHQTERKVLKLSQANNRFKDVPVVEQRNLVPMTNRFTQRIESSSSEQGDMVVSQSTTFGRGKPLNDSPPSQPPVDYNNQRTNDQAYAQSQTIPAPQAAYNQAVQAPYHSASHATESRERFIAPHNKHPNAHSLHVNTRRFNLNYDVKAVNPSGVGRVVLWVTKDGGATWKSWLTDPDNLSPFPVEIQEEGVYGFRVVINSKDGIVGKPPMSNDTPDVWVQVDLSTPKVALTSAPYGSGKDTGKLILHWEAYDQFLTDRPIKLAYSPAENGPWTTISDRLRNSGSYAWKVPPQVPQQIFVRIEASDQAKNVGVFQTSSPIDISGLIPRGRIYSVEPIQ